MKRYLPDFLFFAAMAIVMFATSNASATSVIINDYYVHEKSYKTCALNSFDITGTTATIDTTCPGVGLGQQLPGSAPLPTGLITFTAQDLVEPSKSCFLVDYSFAADTIEVMCRTWFTPATADFKPKK